MSSSIWNAILALFVLLVLLLLLVLLVRLALLALLVLLVLLVLAPLRRVPIGLVLFQAAATHACASVRKLRVGRHGPGHNTTATTAQLDEQNLL